MRQTLGPYRLVRQLGSGATADVYLAEREVESGSQRVALKCLRAGLDPALIQLFEREARLGQRLDHANLVRTIDSGEIEGRHFLTMEWIAGPSLVELMSREETVPAARILGMVTDLCDGLHYLHTDGNTIHRDVNPSNVLIGADGRTKLADFGVCADKSDRSVRGTYAYMAPELVRGKPIDRRSDVFSVGVILWELFAARRLFLRQANHLSLAAVVEDAAPSLAEMKLSVPQGAQFEIQAIVQEALTKNPDERTHGCDELADRLRAVATGYRWETY